MSKTCKVADLIGSDLDYCVARATGDTENPNFVIHNGEPCLRAEFDPEGPAHYFDHAADFAMWWALRYSTDWGQGGPIIERERIQLAFLGAYWGATVNANGDDDDWALTWTRGPDPLTAAMRAYVTSKFGETVELP